AAASISAAVGSWRAGIQNGSAANRAAARGELGRAFRALAREGGRAKAKAPPSFLAHWVMKWWAQRARRPVPLPTLRRKPKQKPRARTRGAAFSRFASA